MHESNRSPRDTLIRTFAAILRQSRMLLERIEEVMTPLLSQSTKIGRMHFPKMNSPMNAFRSYVLILGNYWIMNKK